MVCLLHDQGVGYNAKSAKDMVAPTIMIADILVWNHAPIRGE